VKFIFYSKGKLFDLQHMG